VERFVKSCPTFSVVVLVFVFIIFFSSTALTTLTCYTKATTATATGSQRRHLNQAPAFRYKQWTTMAYFLKKVDRSSLGGLIAA
jgi:hypothetical protein